MKDIKAIRGRYYIHGLIQEGEHEHQDFKFAITDAPKIAHSISAFANNDGGHLLIGVRDNGSVAGVRSKHRHPFQVVLAERVKHQIRVAELSVRCMAPRRRRWHICDSGLRPFLQFNPFQQTLPVGLAEYELDFLTLVCKSVEKHSPQTENTVEHALSGAQCVYVG